MKKENKQKRKAYVQRLTVEQNLEIVREQGRVQHHYYSNLISFGLTIIIGLVCQCLLVASNAGLALLKGSLSGKIGLILALSSVAASYFAQGLYTKSQECNGNKFRFLSIVSAVIAGICLTIGLLV